MLAHRAAERQVGQLLGRYVEQGSGGVGTGMVVIHGGRTGGRSCGESGGFYHFSHHQDRGEQCYCPYHSYPPSTTAIARQIPWRRRPPPRPPAQITAKSHTSHARPMRSHTQVTPRPHTNHAQVTCNARQVTQKRREVTPKARQVAPKSHLRQAKSWPSHTTHIMSKVGQATPKSHPKHTQVSSSHAQRKPTPACRPSPSTAAEGCTLGAARFFGRLV